MIAAALAAALLALGLLVHLALTAVRATGAAAPPRPRITPEQARHAGAEDMRAAWLAAQLGALPPPQRGGDAAFVAARLAEVPRTDWDEAALRRHGQLLWSLRPAAARAGLLAEVEERLDRVAAMLSDLTGREFDTRLGQSDERCLCHPDPQVRAAYLAGGSDGVDAVMRTISEARARGRQDAAARAAADSLARQRNAALRALREIDRATRTRDDHAAWDEQVRQLGG
ncbi:hypothetical protein [Kocuria flava]